MLLTFSYRSTHICVLKGKIEVAEVHNFVHRALNIASGSTYTHLLWIASTHQIFIFKHSKMQCNTFFVIWLLFVQAFPPASSN
jgi:hypothetical protein